MIQYIYKISISLPPYWSEDEHYSLSVKFISLMSLLIPWYLFVVTSLRSCNVTKRVEPPLMQNDLFLIKVLYILQEEGTNGLGDLLFLSHLLTSSEYSCLNKTATSPSTTPWPSSPSRTYPGTPGGSPRRSSHPAQPSLAPSPLPTLDKMTTETTSTTKITRLHRYPIPRRTLAFEKLFCAGS